MVETSSSIPASIQREMDILALPHSIRLDNETYVEGQDALMPRLREVLRADPRRVSTSAVGPGTFLQAFSAALSQGRQVLLICLPSRFSCTVQNAHIARDMCARPDQVFIFDGKLFGFNLTKLAVAAAQLADRGMGAGQILQQLSLLRQRMRAVAWLADMPAVIRGGRAGDVVRIPAGSVLDVQPVVALSPEGAPYILRLARTMRQGIDALVDHVQARGVHEGEVLCIEHGNNPEGARLLLEELRRRLPGAAVIEVEPGSLLYIHLGEGTLSLSV